MSKIYFLSIFLSILCAFSAHAQTSYTSNVSDRGDWADATSWLPVGVPGSADDATVVVGDTIDLVTNEQVDDLLINGVLDHFQRTLTINGSYEVNGQHLSDENIVMNGVGQTINGTGSIRLVGNKDLQINDDRTILSTANITINLDVGLQDIVIATATVTNLGKVKLIGGMVKGGANGTWINSTNSELEVYGAISTVNFTFTASASGNIVNYKGSSRTLTLPTGNTYHHLQVNGSGTKTLAGNIIVNGDLSNFVTFDASGFDIDLNGDWTNTGTFTPGTGEVIFSGTTDQSINSTETFYDLNAATTSGQLSLSDNVVVQNLLTINTNILAGTNQITVGTGVGTGSVTYTSGLIDGSLERYTTSAASQSIDFQMGAPDFDVQGYKLLTLTLSSTTISSGGSILVEFVNSVPGNGGSPWTEVSTYNNTFADGYWQVTDKNGFALTTFDLSLKIDELEGFTIDNSERVLAGTSPNWIFKGSHGTNDGINVTRTGLSVFEDFVLASTNSCTPPSAPAFTLNPTSACINSSDGYTVTQVSGLTYYWTVTGGSFSENGSMAYNAFEDNNVTVDWGSIGGNYEVTVLAFDPTCTFSDVSTTSVALEPFSPSSISGNNVLEQNSQDEPYSVTNLGANYSYNWTINGGTQDMGGTTENITVDWGPQGAASVVVNSSTTDCPAENSPNETLSITLFTTFVTASGGDIDTDANWINGTAPGDLDNIRLEHAMTDNADKRFNHVIISAPGSLTTNKAIEITGLFENNGSLSITANKDLTLSATESFDLEGTGSVTVQDLVFSGSNRNVDSLATLTWNVSNSFDLGGITLTHKGSLTLSDVPPGGTGTIDTSDPDNVIIYGGAAQDFSSNTIIPNYYNLTISGTGAKQLQNDISVLGDLTQSGTAALDGSTNTARVTLAGTSETQTLSGTLDFYDLTVNNTFATIPQITNGGTTTITNSGTFTDGVVANSGTLTFNDATSTSTTNSFVDGPVEFIAGGNTSFTYPVGDGSIWARLGAGTLTSGSQFTGQYFYTDPQVAFGTAIDGTDFPNPAAAVSTEEYWVLSYGGGGASSAIVTLYWEDGTRSGITDLSDLTITKWDGSDWGSDGGITTSTTGVPALGTVFTTAAYTTFSPFTFASATGNNPLPVEIVSFIAESKDLGVLLEWETAVEINNEYFELEISDTGETFAPVARINSQGNSNVMQSYQYLDQMPFEGINYYRLKQVDLDGSFSFSDIISVEVESTPFNISVYPNPVSNGILTLTGNLKSVNEMANIRIMSSLGKIVLNKKIRPAINRFTEEYQLDIPTGVYFIELQQGIYRSVARLIVYEK